MTAPPVRSAPRNLQTILILASLLLGLLAGALLRNAPELSAGVLAVARPLGALWIDALTMTIVPLVFGLLVTGVAAASAAASDRVAQRALIWFALLLLGACVVGAGLATAALAWAPIPEAAANLRPPPPSAGIAARRRLDKLHHPAVNLSGGLRAPAPQPYRLVIACAASAKRAP